MLNLCKYFGNYFGIQSFRFKFAIHFKIPNGRNYQNSDKNVHYTWF